MNFSLYSICFSGAARTGTQCELCLSLSQPTRDCSRAGGQESEVHVATCLRTLRSVVLAITSNVPQQQSFSSFDRTLEVCRNWNVGKCPMLHCCIKHVCKVCGGPNPAYDCCDQALGPRSDPFTQFPAQPAGGSHVEPGPSPRSPTLGSRHFGPGSADRGSRLRPNSQPY